MIIKYRMDRVKKLSEEQPYEVPSGMDTLCHVSDTKYSTLRLYYETSPRLTNDEVFLHSKWDEQSKEFVIYAISANGPLWKDETPKKEEEKP